MISQSITEESVDLDRIRTSIVRELEAQADPDRVARILSVEKDKDYVGYGMRVPALREIMNRFKKVFKQLSVPERLSLAQDFVEAGIGEQADVAIQLLALSANSLLPDYLDYLDHFLDHFRSWGATDNFCINVLQPLLVSHSDLVLPLLERWSRSANRWKRRASVVAFARKVGASGRFTDQCLRLCDVLIWDKDDLVRKGIGWALKDTMRGDKERVLAYVEDLRRRGVSSTITLYAIRDLKGPERESLLAVKGKHGEEEWNSRTS